ncbi:hypothetical protein [Streptomyces sp. NPDC003697]
MAHDQHHDQQSASPADDQQVAERLVPVWLEETRRNDAEAARRAEEGWQQGSLSPEAAQDLAHWVTARVTDTGFNEDEGPDVRGPAHITPADKESVHRWLAARGHRI